LPLTYLLHFFVDCAVKKVTSVPFTNLATLLLFCQEFVYNLDGILILAFVGTALNVVLVAAGVYFTGVDESLSLLKCFILAAIMSAVDPVAVLAVFRSAISTNYCY
jgi:hypothetical protein